MINKKEIQQFIHAARRDDSASFDMIEKHVFTSMLAGMKIKLYDRLIKDGKNKDVERNIAALDRMDAFLERLSFKNCVFHFQAKTILAQDRRIILLEQEKMDLIKENDKLKSYIK